MKENTLIVNAEEIVTRYREGMMEFFIDTQGDHLPSKFAADLIAFGKTLAQLCSVEPGVAFDAFRRELHSRYSMMMLDPRTFNQLEQWDNADEDFHLAIFRENGAPVGLVSKEYITW